MPKIKMPFKKFYRRNGNKSKQSNNITMSPFLLALLILPKYKWLDPIVIEIGLSRIEK